MRRRPTSAFSSLLINPLPTVTSSGAPSQLGVTQVSDEAIPLPCLRHRLFFELTMAGYSSEIAWETEVWCADAPTHLIHFNGERFLGPYS